MQNTSKLKLSSFISALYFYVPVFSLYLVNNQVEISDIVFAQVIYSISAFSFEVPTGILADKLGQKFSILLGHGLDALGLFLVFIFPSTLILYVAQFTRGISGAALSGSNEALMYESVKQENGNSKIYKKEFSTFLSNAVLGFAISTFIAGIIMQFFGASSYPLLILGTVFALIINILLVLTLKGTNGKIVDKTKSKELLFELKKSIKLFSKSQILRAIALTVMLTYAGRYFLMESYQPYFELNEIPPLFIGLVISIGSLINFFVIKYSYLLEKKLILPSIILLLSSLIALGYVFLGMGLNPIVIVLAFILIYGLIGAEQPVISDFVNANITSDVRSTALSTISFGKELAKTIIKLGLGFSIGLIGVGQTYIVYGLYIFIGALISFLLLRRTNCVYDTWKTLRE